MLFEPRISDNPAGIFLALFAPVWLLVRRRRANVTERACLFFAVLSYLYWGFMGAFLRYAIPMFFVLYALTAGRLIELGRESGPALRRATAAGLVACLLFSATVTALYVINMPQLLYLSGRLSKREFLLRANRFYASVETLSQVALPGERTYSVDNQAVLYAPDPQLFTYTNTWKGTPPVEQVLSKLAEKDYRYLIIPIDVRESYLPALSRERKLDLLHEDKYFLLYRLTPS